MLVFGGIGESFYSKRFTEKIATVGIISGGANPNNEIITRLHDSVDAVINLRSENEDATSEFAYRISEFVNKSGFVNPGIKDITNVKGVLMNITTTA